MKPINDRLFYCQSCKQKHTLRMWQESALAKMSKILRGKKNPVTVVMTKSVT